MDLFHANEKTERKEPLAAYLAKAEEIETKLLPKIAKMNKDLIKSKRIQFYGTHDEAQPSQAINHIQEEYDCDQGGTAEYDGEEQDGTPE